ncbi:hypothetical protein GDO86_013529, partial [Hymenochirus boettgeri]
MNMSQSESLNPYQLASLAIIMFETLIGSLANGFIVIVNFTDLANHGTLGTCDVLILCIGLSRLVFLWILSVTYTMSFLLSNLASFYLIYPFLFFNYVSLWFSTLLCAFYYIHFARIDNCFFKAFKKVLNSYPGVFLIYGVLMSIVFILPMLYDNMTSRHSNCSRTPTVLPLSRPYSVQVIIFPFLGSIFPFILFSRSAFWVICVLGKHVLKMKGQAKTNFKKPSLEAHYGAVKAIAQFFLIYCVYVISYNLYLSGTVPTDTFWGFLCSMLIGAYPSLHSVLLILQNNKFKEVFIGILQKL